MWILIQDILGRLLMAFVFNMIWHVASMFIMYIISLIRKKDFSAYYFENNDLFWTNFILIFICLLIFYRE